MQNDYDQNDGRFDEIDGVDRNQIEQCDDEATLANWYALHGELADHISTFTGAHREGMGESVDTAWLRRSSDKIAYLRIAQRRIEDRMLELGFTVPYRPTHPLKKQITMLNKAVRRYRAMLRDAGIKLDPSEVLA